MQIRLDVVYFMSVYSDARSTYNCNWQIGQLSITVKQQQLATCNSNLLKVTLTFKLDLLFLKKDMMKRKREVDDTEMCFCVYNTPQSQGCPNSIGTEKVSQNDAINGALVVIGQLVLGADWCQILIGPLELEVYRYLCETVWYYIFTETPVI